MSLLFRNGAFVADDWRALAPDEDAPLDGKVILTPSQWRRIRDSHAQANISIGLRVEPGESLDEILPDLPRISLIAVNFPKFSDGRGFSLARQLRVRGGFGGELRAIGDVLFDQLQLMSRCGFDAFELVDSATIRLLESGRRPGVELFYQPGLGAETAEASRPWAWRARA